MLGYTGTPIGGNLYFSLSPLAGADKFGNTYPTGLSIQSGQVQGTALIGTSMDSASTLLGTSVQNAQVLTPNITGGTAASLTHTMGNAGAVLGYSSVATTSVTFATNGVYEWTCPTGITSVRVQCWGAGAGGGGAGVVSGTTTGGTGGGAGEYAEEPSYPVTPGFVYQVVVGEGGQLGAPFFGASDGTPTRFYPSGGTGPIVLAHQGLAGAGAFEGGPGGSGSVNSIHFNGGNGASSNQGLGGAGGGSSAGPAAAGNPGAVASGNTGGAGGVAVTGGGAGGAGGNSGANGTGGSAPGGGGGGGGFAGVNSKTHAYLTSASASYYGSDAPVNPNIKRSANSTMWQGKDSSSNSLYGTQKSIFTFPQGIIASDWVGWIIYSCTLWVTNEHTYYSTGQDVQVGAWTASTSPPATWNGTGATQLSVAPVAEGTRAPLGLGATVGKQFAGQSSPTLFGFSFGPGFVNDFSYSGYFNGSPNDGNGPVLIIAGAAASPSGGAGGNGADGKVILSYYSAAASTLLLSVSATSATDSFGNPYGNGLTVFGANGSFVNINDSGGSGTNTASVTAFGAGNSSVIISVAGGIFGNTAVLFHPGNTSHISLDPQVFAASIQSGLVNEQEALILSSGAASSNDDFELQLFSESADATGGAFMSFIAGGTILSQLFKTVWDIGVPISCTLGTPSNPTLITTDSWNAMSLLAGWSTLAGQPIPSYKLGVENRVHVTGAAQFNVNIGSNALATALPVGIYRPASQIYIAPAPGSAGLQVSSNGGLVAVIIPGATTPFCNFNGSYPLDL